MTKSVHIEDDLHSQLRLEAFDKNKSLQGLVGEILQKHIQHDEQKGAR